MRDVYTAKLSRLSDEVLEMGNLCGRGHHEDLSASGKRGGP